MKGTLRGRLFAAIVVAVLASAALTLVVGSLLVKRSIQAAVETNLGRQADLLAVRAASGTFAPGELAGARLLLARQGERVVLLPLASVASFPGLQQIVANGLPAQGRASVRGQEVLYAVRQVGQNVLVVARPAALQAADWHPFVGSFLLAALGGVALAGVLAFVLARTVTGPVAKVAEASRSLARGEAPSLLEVRGSGELAVLASSFNDMAAQLAAGRESEQTFLLSVSHELKTPLTAIRGYAEGLEEGAVAPAEGGRVIAEESARLERLVQDLLDLARISRRSFAVRPERVDLARIASEAVRRYEPRAKGFGVRLTEASTGPVPATADPDRVLQVVSNLVENALRCTPAGGAVTVSSRVAGFSGGEIQVSDTGPGLGPDERARAFERFYLYRRYWAERPVGTGLGLAIVKDLTEAMDGEVSVASAPGEGTSFTVRLPGPRPDAR